MKSFRRKTALLVVILRIVTIAASSSLEEKTTAASFDAMDPVYQIHDKYPPSKATAWTYDMKYDGWWIAHQALRGELQDFQTALESLTTEQHPNTPAARQKTSIGANEEDTKSQIVIRVVVTAMQNWWRGHLKHMHSHHRNEDTIIKHFATRRFQWPDFVEEDHHNIIERLDTIEKLLQRISKSTSETCETSSPSESIVTCLEELKTVWSDYQSVVLHHLDREERICVALLRAYFSPQEVQRVQQRLAMMGPGVETGAIVYYVGEDYVKESMKAQRTSKIMRWIAWKLILTPRHRYYVKTMVANLDILKHARVYYR